MDLQQSRLVLRQLRDTLARYPSSLAHVACGIVMEGQVVIPSTGDMISCSDVTGPVVGSGELSGLLILPAGLWAQGEEAWAVARAAVPAIQGEWHDGDVRMAVKTLNAALYLLGDRPHLGPFFLSVGVLAGAGILAKFRVLG